MVAPGVQGIDLFKIAGRSYARGEIGVQPANTYLLPTPKAETLEAPAALLTLRWDAIRVIDGNGTIEPTTERSARPQTE